MRRVLVRSGKSPLEAVGPEATLGASRGGLFAGNVGNYLFTDAVHRLLSVAGTEVVSDSYSTELRGVSDAHLARINEEFDHLVIPLANAFRTSYVDNLTRLTRVVESLDIPVSVIGSRRAPAAGRRTLHGAARGGGGLHPLRPGGPGEDTVHRCAWPLHQGVRRGTRFRCRPGRCDRLPVDLPARPRAPGP